MKGEKAYAPILAFFNIVFVDFIIVLHCGKLFLPPESAPRTLRVPLPVAADGDTSQEVPQEAEKTHVAPFATHLSYVVEHGTAINVVVKARDRRWSSLGHVLRMPEHRLVRQVLLNCVKTYSTRRFSQTYQT